MQAAESIVSQAGEGEQLWFAGGGILSFRVSDAQSGGSVCIFEDTMMRGKVTPLHLHPDFEETLYVLAGEIVVHVDGVEHGIGAGGLAMAPRGVAHAFCVTSETARVLAILTPGNGEDFYRRLSEPVTSPEDADRPADFTRLRAAAEASDHIEILGPPPFDP